MKSKVLKVAQLSLKFIETLKEDELDKLINGEMIFDIKGKIDEDTSIKIKDTSTKTNKKIKKAVKLEEQTCDWTSIEKSINNCKSREEASSFISSLGSKKDMIIALGNHLGVKIPKSATKPKAIESIVENIVGKRLKVEGLRKGILGE